ncbi:MAG: Card1-like endonuclease domain-containing protein [Moorellales bacterium]
MHHSRFEGTEQNLVGWLRGLWLEHYVLDVLKNLKARLHLTDEAQNLRTQGVEFNVDVAAVRGYQLFVFSCKAASGSRPRLKLGLFEAHVRARQLGGDEARVALVCCAEDTESLEQEIQREFDLRRGRVRVFGRQDLAELSGHLQNWILEQGDQRR